MLATDYDGLVRRLARRFGCSDFASETLHETFVRLDGLTDKTVIQSPKDYLFRAAVNVGRNRRRAERLRASAGEIDALLDVPDEAPIPEQIVDARSEVAALLRVLAELSPRMRRAFEAALFDSRPYAEIATELGVSLRTVERDIQHAMEHCARTLGEVPVRRASGSQLRK
jgi:RNA polymerase sigma-70 factor (ECF subfamily)